MWTKEKKFYPEKIFISPEVTDFPKTKKILALSPQAEKKITGYEEIPDLEEAAKKSFFLDKFRGNFIKRCPCTSQYVCCNYYILNNVFDCPYDCTYCILKGYLNKKCITVFVNTDQIYKELELLNRKKKLFRIGTGELSDSLALDHIVDFSGEFLPFISKLENIIFELKTKSSNTLFLPELKDSSNIVIGFSVNPDFIISSEEIFTPGLAERAASIKAAIDKGYKVALHFDPLFYFKDYQMHYKEAIILLKDSLKGAVSMVAWISMGGLRFTTELKNRVFNLKKFSLINQGEFVKCEDQKWRYPRKIRVEMFNFILNTLKQSGFSAPIYLCMESKKVWNKLDPTMLDFSSLPGLKG